MNRRERQTLEDLLRDLMRAQDTVTHLNETGRGYEYQTRRAIRERDAIKGRLIGFVERLTDDDIPF